MPAIVLADDETEKSTGALKGKKIVMIIGNRMFHDLEFHELKQIFEREEAAVRGPQKNLAKRSFQL
jgi:hypothetical protein